MAIEAHLAVTGTLPCNVAVLLEGEEEIGSPHYRGIRPRASRCFEADVVSSTADGPLHPSGAPVVYFGRAGRRLLRAPGEDRQPRHALGQTSAGVAPNAIWTLVHLLATMKNAAGEITIERGCTTI